MSINKLQIYQFLLQISSIDEQTKLKQKYENHCSVKNNIQQNSKSIDRQKHAVNFHQVYYFVLTN